MMLDYVNVLVEFVEIVAMSVSILSLKGHNCYIFIPSDYVFIGGGVGDIYIYIYWCNLFVVLYDSVVLVWMIEY